MAIVDTLIFDCDDTLYPVSSGFSEHRNGEVIRKFMLAKLGFDDAAKAMRIRNEYFRRYHSSMKGLCVASQEGRLPKPFKEEELSAWFAEECDFAKFLKPDPELRAALETLRDDAKLNLVVFSNAPKRYVQNCLTAVGIGDLFEERFIFGVEDVLPACKPEPSSFDVVLRTVGTTPERTVMFEDSMKNIRACRAMGMHTVLIDEGAFIDGEDEVGSEAALFADRPCADDPAVGAVLQRIGQIRERLPELWERRFHGHQPIPARPTE